MPVTGTRLRIPLTPGRVETRFPLNDSESHRKVDATMKLRILFQSGMILLFAVSVFAQDAPPKPDAKEEVSSKAPPLSPEESIKTLSLIHI